MTTVVFSDEMQLHTGGLKQTQIEASSYRRALRELSDRFPGLTDEVYEKLSVAIDGTIVHRPLLETFEADSELVFIPRIASG